MAFTYLSATCYIYIYYHPNHSPLCTHISPSKQAHPYRQKVHVVRAAISQHHSARACLTSALLLLQSLSPNTSGPIGRWNLTFGISLVQQQCSHVHLSISLVNLPRIQIYKQDDNSSRWPRLRQELPVPRDSIAGVRHEDGVHGGNSWHGRFLLDEVLYGVSQGGIHLSDH